MHRERAAGVQARMRALALAVVVLPFLLGGPVAAGGRDPVTSDASWPLRFFSGKTEGSGALRILFSRAKPLRVQSSGRLRGDGTLILRQTLRIAGETPQSREWRLSPAGGGRYAGTLTDAAGPVSGQVSGNTLSLRYTMQGALRLRIHQMLVLQPDGRTVANRLRATKLGLPVAALRETIRKTR